MAEAEATAVAAVAAPMVEVVDSMVVEAPITAALQPLVKAAPMASDRMAVTAEADLQQAAVSARPPCGRGSAVRVPVQQIFGRQILGRQIFVPPSTMASGIRSATTPLRPRTSFLLSTEEVMAGAAVAGVGVEE
jgi:hypothetical protein